MKTETALPRIGRGLRRERRVVDEGMTFGRSFLEESTALPLVFGCEQLGGHNWGRVTAQDVLDAVHFALDHDVRLFDTADCYGLGASEERLGQALAGRRKDALICTKFGVRFDEQGRRVNDSTPRWCRQALQRSLQRLKTDYVDLYQLHCWDGLTPLDETIGELVRLEEQGLIRAIGICNVDFVSIPSASLRACATVSAEFSLLESRSLAAIVRQCEAGRYFLAYGVLSQGLLSGRYGPDAQFDADDRRRNLRYKNFHGERLLLSLKVVNEVVACAREVGCSPATLAIAWVKACHRRIWPIVGIKRTQHIREAIEAVQIGLSEEIVARLNTAAGRIGGGHPKPVGNQ